MYDFHSTLLHFQPDNDYPLSEMSRYLQSNKLRPMKINSKNIIEGIEAVTKLLENNDINQAKARSFLKYLGLSAAAMKKIIDCATGSENNEGKYKLPSCWYGNTDLSFCCDVPMHLLMLGVVKSVMLRIGVWLRSKSNFSYFCTKVDGVLGHIKSMNVEWCKILEFPKTDKFGGWVSENFASMARIGNWFYSMIKYLPEENNYEDPITHYSTWSRQQCDKWLFVRGKNKVGKIAELKTKIGEYFEADKVPTIIVKDTIRQEDILQLMEYTCLMIKTVMTPHIKISDIKYLEALIRGFLIYYDKTDMQQSKDSKPAWITQSNPLSLLNLPDVMRKYGSVRNIWEGGTDGEAYLKNVKYQLKAGLVNDWQTWCITNLLRNDIFGSWKDNDSSCEQSITITIRKECKVYCGKTKAINSMNSGRPFSAIFLHDKYYVCYRDNGNITGAEIIISNNAVDLNNVVYFHIEFGNEIKKMCDNETGFVGVLFLPKLTANGYPNTKQEDSEYCMVKSDWS